jgi:hypothetical protein
MKINGASRLRKLSILKTTLKGRENYILILEKTFGNYRDN